MGDGPYRESADPSAPPALDVVVFPEDATIDLANGWPGLPVRTALRWIIEAAAEGKVLTIRFDDPVPERTDWDDPTTLGAP